MSSYVYDEGLILSTQVILNEYEPDKNRSLRWVDDFTNQFALYYHNDSAKICMTAIVEGISVYSDCVTIDSAEWLGQDGLWHELTIELIDDEMVGLRDGKVMHEIQDTLLTHAYNSGYIQLSLLNAQVCFDDVTAISLVPEPYVCGDVNLDQNTDVSDAVFIVNYAFGGGTAPDPYYIGDVNCDSMVDVSDAVYIINYAFVPGSPLPCQNCPL